MSRAIISVGVPAEVHAKIKSISEENGNLKLWSVIEIISRGWDLLTNDQQTQAIRGADDARLASSLGDKPQHDLRTEVANLISDTAQLNQVICDAYGDGKCDAKERRRVRAILKQVLKRVDGTAQLAAC